MRETVRVVRVWLVRAALGLLLIVLVLAASLWLKNPVFTTFPVAVAWNESPASLYYWGRFLLGYLDSASRTLRFDPATAVGGLSAARSECTNPPPARLFACGQVAWHSGSFREAIDLFKRDIRANGERQANLFWLGLSLQRLAEADNCLRVLVDQSRSQTDSGTATHTSTQEHPSAGRHPHGDHARMCALPLSISHDDVEPALAAARVYQRLLEEYGSDHVTQWLLNFTYMTAGGYPDDVPARHRIPESNNFLDFFYGAREREIQARYENLRFTEVASEIGVAFSRFEGQPDAGRGIAVEDFNGDGCLDIVTGGYFRSIAYYENRCAGTGELGFEEHSQASGLAEIRGTHVITAADYDNDGWMDLFAGRPFGSPRGDFVLLRNTGHGRFENVTQSAGLLPPDDSRYHQVWGSAWGDIDNDGDLDLFVAQWAFWNANFKRGWSHIWNALDENASSRLFRNDNGQFTDITDAMGLEKLSRHNVIGATFGDYDGDGHVDLAVTLLYFPGVVLLHNQAGERFVRNEAIRDEGLGFMTSFVDVDHDGKLDLFVGGMGIAESVIPETVFGEGQFHTGSRLWLQKSPDHWILHSDFFAGDMPLPTMGASFGDVDHDGNLDWYLGTGNPQGWLVVPNLMYMGVEDAAGTMSTVNVSALGGLGTVQKGHGIVFADFDEDGDQDIYSALGGFWPGDAWPNQLWRNDSQASGRWVRLELHGCTSNRFGLNASIRLLVELPGGGRKTFHYLMDNKTGFGSAPYRAHLGLGKAERIVSTEVDWIGPGGKHTTSHSVGMGRLNVLTETGESVGSRAEAQLECRKGTTVSATALDSPSRGGGGSMSSTARGEQGAFVDTARP